MSIDVEAFYIQYGPMVMRRCRHLLKHEEEAADAMQETFVRLLASQDRLDDSAPASLLYQTATRVCLNRLRGAKRRPETFDEELLQRIAQAPESEDRSLAKRILDSLFSRERESTRTIAVLHLLDGLTLEEVAQEVGLSVSGVRKRLRTLREHLHDMPEVELP